jgi:uncharacterized membrane protein (UPF0127 family)
VRPASFAHALLQEIPVNPCCKSHRDRAGALVAATLAVLLCSLATVRSHAQGEPPLENLANFPRTTLTIHSGAAAHRFTVWIADTQARKEQGLMFVRDLPADQGMLFPQCCTGIWMKNTYIELDIVFVGADHRIMRIAARAQPFDLTTISPGGTADAVVELRGGEAARRNLKVGDRVDWSAPQAA